MESPRVPVHPGITTSSLPNGLTCWTLPYGEPTGSVAMALHVAVGSLSETEAQRGVSHMLEHLAFEGGAHYPPGELERFFESLGTRVGRHHNAFTGREWTCYTLCLPDHAERTVDGGLACLADFAYGMSMAPEAVETERRVILEEMRQYHGTRTRLREKVLSLLLPGTLVPERHPLGRAEVVRSVSVEQLRSYYERSYRPDVSTLLIAGAIDPDAVQCRIRHYFAGWRPAAEASPAAAVGIRAFTGPRAAVFTDPEDEKAQVRFIALRPPTADGTLIEMRARLVEEIGLRMVNRRWGGLLREEETPLRSAHIGLSPLVRGWSLLQAVADGSPDRWRELLETLAIEVVRVREHGFSFEELERERGHVLASARRAAHEEADLSAGVWLAAMLDAVPQGRPPMSAGQRLELLETLLPELTPQETRASLADSLSSSTRLSVVTLPDRDGARPAEEEILRLQSRAESQPVSPPATRPRRSRLSDRVPEPGTVAEQKEDSRLGVTSSRFANGVLVHVRPMESGHRTYVELTLAGGRIREDAANLGVTGAAALAFSGLSIASCPPPEIRDVLSDELVELRCSVEEDAVTLRICVESPGLDKGLELLHLLLSEPRLDAAMLERWRGHMERRQGMTLETRLALEGVRLLTGDDPRFRLLSDERARAITLEEAASWLGELCGAPIEAAIAGDADPGLVQELALRYLGSLPDRACDAGELDPLRGWASARGPLVSRIEAESVTPRAAVLSGWRAASWQAVDDRRLLKMASQVLSQRCYRVLRKQRGLTYSAACSFSPSRAYAQASLLSVAFYAPPERAEEAVTVSRGLVQELADDGPGEEEMEAVRKQFREIAVRAEKSAKYWSHVLSDFHYRQLRARDLESPELSYRHYTGEDLKAALRRYVDEERRIEVICLPGSAMGGR